MLAALAGRTCAELLIRGALGYVFAVEDDGGLGAQAARLAINGRAVVDTSAVVVAPWTGHVFKRLTARFDSVIIPAPAREDIARARGSLAMKSTSTIGWDSREQRPTLSEITAAEAQRFADEADRAWADVQGLQVAPFAGVNRVDEWLSAVTVAQELGLPVWADDIALRRIARSMGVAAFGSLDLIEAFADGSDLATARAALREKRVVDLPLDDPWHVIAARSNWDPSSPLAVALSRPAPWSDVTSAWAQFRLLFRRRPADMSPQHVAQWAFLTASGLALAAEPPIRPKVVSALLAWVVFNADPLFEDVQAHSGTRSHSEVPTDSGQVAKLVFDVAQHLGDRYYPAADPISALVDVLREALIDSVGPERTSRVMASLARELDPTVGRRVFAAFMRSARD